MPAPPTQARTDDAANRRIPASSDLDVLEHAFGPASLGCSVFASPHALGPGSEHLVEEIAEVYSRALFDVAPRSTDILDDVHDQLGRVHRQLDKTPRHAGVLLLPVLLVARRRRTASAS